MQIRGIETQLLQFGGNDSGLTAKGWLGMGFGKALISTAVLSVTAGAAIANSFVLPTEWSRGDAGSTYFEWQFFITGTGVNPPTAATIPADASATIQDISGSSVVAGSGSLYNQPQVSQIEVKFETAASDTGRWISFVNFQTLTLGREFAYNDMRIGEEAFTARTELERIFLGIDGPFGGYVARNLFEFRVLGLPELVISAPAEDLSLSLDDAVVDSYTLQTCDADADLDFDTDIEDLLLVLNRFGREDATVDMDGDGEVTIEELLNVLRDFGCVAR